MTVMCEFCKERPMRTLLHGAMACLECRDEVLNWSEKAKLDEEGETDEMSRGPGYCMRRVKDEVEKAGNKSMTRRELEDVLCGEEGFRSDNVLRSIRTLHSLRVAYYQEGRFPETSRVSIPQPVENPLSNEEVFALIDKMMDRS